MYDSYQEATQIEESIIEPLTATHLQGIFNNIIGLFKANKVATLSSTEMASKILTHLFQTDLSLQDVKSKMENYIIPGINNKSIKDNLNEYYLFGKELGREEANNKFLEWKNKRIVDLSNAKPSTQEANPDVNPEFFKPRIIKGKPSKSLVGEMGKTALKYIPFIKVESKIKNVTNLKPIIAVDEEGKQKYIVYVLFTKFVQGIKSFSLYKGKTIHGLLKDSYKETVFTKYPDLFRNLENNKYIVEQLKSFEGKVAIDTIAEFVEHFHNEYVKANTKISDLVVKTALI